MSDEYTPSTEGEPTPPTPSPAEGVDETGGPIDPNASPTPFVPSDDLGAPTAPGEPPLPNPLPPEPETPAPDVLTTADSVTRPAVTAAAPTAPGIPDETHNSIDPQTGALTSEALERRAEIVRLVQEAGHAVASFEEAIKHWVDGEVAQAPPGDLS